MHKTTLTYIQKTNALRARNTYIYQLHYNNKKPIQINKNPNKNCTQKMF